MTVSIKKVTANSISTNPINHGAGKCVDAEVAQACGIGFENTVAMVSGIRGAFYKEDGERAILPLDDFTSLESWDCGISTFQVDFFGMDIDSYGGGIFFSKKKGGWDIYARVAGPRLKDRGEMYKALKPSENGNRIFELKIQHIPVQMGDFILSAIRDGRKIQIQGWKPAKTRFLGKAYTDPNGINRIEGTPSTYVLAFVDNTHPEYVTLGQDKSIEFGMTDLHKLYTKMSEVEKVNPFEGLADTPASLFYQEVMKDRPASAPLQPQAKVEEVKQKPVKEVTTSTAANSGDMDIEAFLNSMIVDESQEASMEA